MTGPPRIGLRVVSDADQKKKEFYRQKARLRDAILHDQQLTPTARLVGYEIADHLNHKTGDAWPSQETLADRTGYSVKTVQRATKRLEFWFTRKIDGESYRYFPKFDQLAERNARQNVRRGHPTFATRTPDNRDGDTRQNVRLSSLREPNREPTGACGQVSEPPPSLYDQDVERGMKDAIPFDQEIAARAASGGAPRFAFEDSEPLRAWNEYRALQGFGPLPTRQHMVGGRWRIGSDVPTLWPPGYGRVKPRRRT
jgi:Helix-turn-helix domain